jgi:anti-sigma regulatory factor (Ser/Thr protein kinase)
VDEKPLYEGCQTIVGGDFDRAGEASGRIKTVLKEMGLPIVLVRRAALVAYESEINIVSYARKGMMRLRVVRGSVVIEAIDEGPGIPDIELAMQPGYSTASPRIREMGFGAGMGLSNIKSFSDSFQISSEVGRGTYLKMIIKMDNDSLIS